MAKDPLDIGSGINIADGVERGIAPFPTNQMFVDWTVTTGVNNISTLLDGDNATTLTLSDGGEAYYLKLKDVIYADNITMRFASTLGARTLRAWYSPDTGSTTPTTWYALTNGVYMAADTPSYAYRCNPTSGTAPFAVCWIKVVIEGGI